MTRSRALACLLSLVGAAACGDEAPREPGTNPPDSSGGAGAAATTVESSPEAALPGACGQPVAPELCLWFPGGAVTSTQELGQGLFGFTHRLSAEVTARQQAPENELDSYGCSFNGGEPLPSADLEWLQLEVGTRTAWLALSTPADGLGVTAGDRVEVEYTMVDDLLRDFGPKSLSLTLRNPEGELLAWLATSDSISSLGELAPAPVTLSAGAALCQTSSTCWQLEQRALEVGIGSTELVLAQGTLDSAGGWRVLAGQSEMVTGATGQCESDGYQRLASVAVWRVPE